MRARATLIRMDYAWGRNSVQVFESEMKRAKKNFSPMKSLRFAAMAALAFLSVSDRIGHVRAKDRADLVARWAPLENHPGHARPTISNPRISELGRAWADDIVRAGGSVSLEEIRAIIAVTRSSGDEDHAWEAAREHWQASLSADLEQRIFSNPGDENLRAALAYCALTVSPTTLGQCFGRLATEPASFVHLLVDMHGAQRRISSKTRARRVRPLLALLPSAAVEIFRALSLKDKPPSAVSQAALSLLDQTAETATPFLLNKIVPVLIISGGAPSAAIRRWLVETTDNRLAAAAAEAAISIRDDALVWLALDHARADAREVALALRSEPIPLKNRK